MRAAAGLARAAATCKPASPWALRAGVAVYPILLSVDDDQTRSALGRLAAASGGAAFSIGTVGELDGVYRQIEEELRRQYLLVYASTRGERPSAFRRVEVRVDGYRTRALRGYYP